MGVSSLLASRDPKAPHPISQLEVVFIDFVPLAPTFLEMESVLTVMGAAGAMAADTLWLPHSHKPENCLILISEHSGVC